MGTGGAAADRRVAPASVPPSGLAVGYQRWHEILFLHWDVSPDALRELVDPRLELDLFEGRAWISVTPFTMRGARLRFLPQLPWISEFHELNVRTYVRAGGVPGIWFASLDAASAPAAAVARAFLGLPYYRARMARSASGDDHEYRSARLRLLGRPARFSAAWSVGPVVTDPPGSLDAFLAERYALYTTVGGRLLRVRVRHLPWVLREARIVRLDQTLTHAAGVEVTERPTLARFSEGADVEVLLPELVR